MKGFVSLRFKPCTDELQHAWTAQMTHKWDSRKYVNKTFNQCLSGLFQPMIPYHYYIFVLPSWLPLLLYLSQPLSSCVPSMDNYSNYNGDWWVESRTIYRKGLILVCCTQKTWYGDYGYNTKTLSICTCAVVGNTGYKYRGWWQCYPLLCFHNGPRRRLLKVTSIP